MELLIAVGTALDNQSNMNAFIIICLVYLSSDFECVTLIFEKTCECAINLQYTREIRKRHWHDWQMILTVFSG